MGYAIVLIIAIVIVILIVKTFIGALTGSGEMDIRCDGCGNYSYVSKKEYDKKAHQEGLVKYYCGKCRGIGRENNYEDSDDYNNDSNYSENNEFAVNIFTSDFDNIGFIDFDGTICDKDAARIGSVEEDGSILDFSFSKIGNFEKDGRVYNIRNEWIGSIEEGGKVYDTRGNDIGFVESSKAFYLIAGGAALLLLW